MLSMETEVKACDIAGFTKLPARSEIWLMHGLQGDDLVVKYEQTVTKEALKPTSQVLKAIDPLARMKMLTSTEVGELRKALAFNFNLQEGVTDKTHRDRLYAFIRVIDGKQYQFTKMRKQVMMTLDTAVTRAISGNVKDIQFFTKALLAKQGLEKLGEVAAGDAFVGNEDRFMFGQGLLKKKLGDRDYELQCIWNVGNVILSMGTSSDYMPTMLDYMDPGNFSVSSAVKLDRWPGRFLLSHENRTAMGKLICADLEVLLSPVEQSTKPKLGHRAYRRIRSGLEEGIRKIIRQLQAYEKQKKKLPPGAESRLELLMTAGIKT